MPLFPFLLAALLTTNDPALQQEAATSQRPPAGRSSTEKTIPVPKGTRLTVTNNAGLTSSAPFTVTPDTTAPSGQSTSVPRVRRA